MIEPREQEMDIGEKAFRIILIFMLLVVVSGVLAGLITTRKTMERLLVIEYRLNKLKRTGTTYRTIWQKVILTQEELDKNYMQSEEKTK